MQPLPHFDFEMVVHGHEEIDAGAELDQPEKLTPFYAITLLEIAYDSSGQESGDLSESDYVAIVSLEHGQDLLVELPCVLSEGGDLPTGSIARANYSTLGGSSLHMNVEDRQKGDDPMKLAFSYERIFDDIDSGHPPVSWSKDGRF
jgi:hypothetical protein